MMAVAALRQLPPDETNAACGLLSFLRFWSTFDVEKHGISIEPSELFDKGSRSFMSKKAEEKVKVSFPGYNPSTVSKLFTFLTANQGSEIPEWLLSLQDPSDPTNDLGRKGLLIKSLQSTCAVVFQQLMDRMTEIHDNTLFPMVGFHYIQQMPGRAQLNTAGLILSGEPPEPSSKNESTKLGKADDVKRKIRYYYADEHKIVYYFHGKHLHRIPD